MREKLKEYVHLLFAGTVGKEDMEQEILQNTLDRFDDWVSRGFSEEDAYRKAVSGIGDIDALLGRAASPEREEASGYVPLGKRICNAVAVFLYITCPIPLFIFQNGIGLCCLLAMVACGVVIQILAGKLMDSLETYNPISGGTRVALTVIAIFFYILCPVPLFLLQDEFGLCCLLTMVALGVAMQLIAGKSTGQTMKIEEGPQSEVQKCANSLLWLLTVAVYLLISFRTHAWWITWILFPIADSLIKLVFALLGKHSLRKPALSVLLTAILCAFLFSIPVKRLTIGALSVGNFANRGTESASQSFHASEVQSLDIDWVDGSVSIRQDTGDTLRYTVTGADADRTVYSLKDGRLSISATESSILNFGGHRGAELTVLVPDGWMPRELSVESISAPIRIENLNGTELDVDTVSGVMELTDIRADELSLSTISAKITCSGAARDVSLETTSGNCALELTERPEKIDLESVSGDLELFLPKKAGFALRLDTVSGKFRSDFDYSTPQGDTYLSGDGSCAIRAETVSGNVDIRQK